MILTVGATTASLHEPRPNFDGWNHDRFAARTTTDFLTVGATTASLHEARPFQKVVAPKVVAPIVVAPTVVFPKVIFKP